MDKNIFYLLCLLLLVTVACRVVSQHADLKEKALRRYNDTHNAPRAHRENLHHRGPRATNHRHHSNKQHGMIDREACAQCEPLVGELVCGVDGNTYVTLCHAVHCAGLTEQEVTMGACTETAICEQANCKRKTCIPKLAQCVPWKTDRGKSLRCEVHHCAAKCIDEEDVCGMDSKTYSSLCSLYEAGTSLAYEGMCNPSKCRSAVCGTNRISYHSSCHAKAQGVRVHYTGNCFSDNELDYAYKKGSMCNLIAARCKNVTCFEPFTPPDSCCRMCGGGLLLQQKAITKPIKKIIRRFHYNSISTIKNAIVDLLPVEAAEACDLTVALTNNGYIAILLEPVVHHRSIFCKAASSELARRISNPSSSLEPPTSLLMELYEVHTSDLSSSLPDLPTPAMFIGFDPLGELEDTTNDLRDQAENEASNTYGDSADKFDKRLGDTEDRAYDNSASMLRRFSGVIAIINLTIILVTVI